MELIFSYPMIRELEKQPQGLSGLGAFRQMEANIAFQKQTLAGAMMLVSGGYFPTLGVRPLMGRMIAREDDEGAGNAVAVLSYGRLRARFVTRRRLTRLQLARLRLRPARTSALLSLAVTGSRFNPRVLLTSSDRLCGSD